MKKLILSLAMLTATIAFAQKKEIANAVKAVDSGDLTTANSELSKFVIADLLVNLIPVNKALPSNINSPLFPILSKFNKLKFKC